MGAYTTIDDPSAHFHIQLYTGTGSSHSVTNDANAGDFKPDWVWIKERSSSGGHKTYDSTRGVQKTLQTQSTATETTTAQGLTAFNTDGFTVGSDGGHNQSSATYVAWQWKANGGTTSSNSDGNITTTLQTNSTAGFTIGTYTGAGSSPDDKTIGHGLGAIPDLVIIKGRDGSGLGGAAQYWIVGAPNTTLFGNGGNKHLFLGGTQALMDNSTIWRSANFTSTTIPLGGHAALNGNGAAYVFYAFKNIQGYSKISQYVGNGNSGNTGAFIFTGFKPNFVMLRETGNSNSWWMFDTKRDPFNTADARFAANSSDAEATGSFTDVVNFLSNGFKIKNSDSAWNRSGGTYIYMAFAENPFVTSDDGGSIPTTAR
jgi:hypothetical protein